MREECVVSEAKTPNELTINQTRKGTAEQLAEKYLPKHAVDILQDYEECTKNH